MGHLLERVRVDRRSSPWILKFITPEGKVIKKKDELLINPEQSDCVTIYLKSNPDIVEFYIVRQGDLITGVQSLPGNSKK